MKQLNTGELEFESFDEASEHFAKLLSKKSLMFSANEKNMKTYKNAIVELTNVSYSIPGEKILSSNKYHRATQFWAISEVLSEILNLPRPIMERYLPALMDKNYKITPDRMPCYSYGMRWKEFDQLMNIFNLLNNNPTTKRAFLSIYNGLDTVPGRSDTSCTIGHHFLIRDNKLDLIVHMRSWDFFAGHIYDTFLAGILQRTFLSWLQNANLKDLKLGKIHFHADSLHYYPSKDSEKLINMLKEKENEEVDIKPFLFTIDINQYFEDMYHLMDCELASYTGNFGYAIEKFKKIVDPIIRDFARVYLRRNTTRDNEYEDYKKMCEFETEEMKWWSELK